MRAPIGSGDLVQVVINGQRREVKPGTTVADLLQQMGHNSPGVAVERNRQIVPRAEHTECVLQDADELEIVTLVGGG